MLNLSSGFMTTRHTEMQEKLGLDIIAISEEILEENLYLEMSLTPEEVDGRKALSVSSDARWDKRESGRSYNSLSGCSVMLGNRSGLVIATEPM